MKRLFLAAAILIVLCAPALAQLPLTGAGKYPCGKLMAADQKSPEKVEPAVAQWTQGFMSAMNALSKDNQRELGAISSDDVWDRIDTFCTAHPDDSPLVVAIKMWDGAPHK